MSRVSPGPYSKTRMRVMAVVGLVLGLLVIGMGIAETASGNDDGGHRIIACGAIPVLVILLFTPVAIRRGRM